jgi:hypothetical protein
VIGRAIQGLPVTSYQSTRFTDAARTRTNTPSGPGSGLAISSIRSTSGKPY